MLSSYFKIAWRNIVGNPLFSAINVVGLAIGLACCIIITLFVRYEISYDKHWENADRTYRVTRDFFGNNLRLARVAPPIAPLLKQDFAEVEDATRILQSEATISRGDIRFRETQFVVADPNVFDFFNLDFLSGDARSALANPTDIVLTERAATRYFGNEDPIGQTLNLMNQVDVTVTAVIRDLPDNTHMEFQLIGSMAAIPLMVGPEELESWGSNNYFTYVRLPGGYDPAKLEAQFNDFLVRHWSEDAESSSALGLQLLPDIHLTSDRETEWRVNGSIDTVYTFSAIALFVLLIACINFMNLTTARSTQRAREVGVRKVVGASRSQLITQFMGESILLTAIAMLLAVAIIEVTLPAFSAYLEKPLSFSLANPVTLGLLLVGIVIVGLFAGSYPALYLSKFRPVEVLKGPATGTGSALLRKSLVVFQFATSIALLIATGVVMAQMSYARNMDLGFDKSRNLTSELPYFVDLWEVYEPLKAELESHPDILSAVYSSRVPSMGNNDGQGYIAEGEQLVMENFLGIANIKIDYQWFDHYDIDFVAGRAFRQNEMRIEEPTDENPVVKAVAILNVSAARRFGWSPEEAIAKVIRSPMSRDLDKFIDRTIVGVVPDIHFSSLRDEMKATVYEEPSPDYARNISVKLAAGDHRAAIAHFEETWKKLLPNEPIFWQFLEDRFDALYRSEGRQAQMFGVFSAFAIFVATLGLFGLASFTTERRTKEIGIRKVMGASVKDIIMLLTIDFTKLVLLANVIAWPLAYFYMKGWLSRFVYQAPLGNWAWLFLASAVAAFSVAWITIALQAGRAATARPVMALRYE
ncbi:MAG: ABC transporter permease [Proteobacteria bacterium]|nr:ABC transporter permease [Pseudomonadota bacterium]MDA0992974.1 ABC transporter permease [Pseudomonadota bacterium]